MRLLLGLLVTAAVIGPALPARANEWCGFLDKDHSRVRCGYSSLAECQQSLLDKKGAYCMPDPSFARAAGRDRIALK